MEPIAQNSLRCLLVALVALGSFSQSACNTTSASSGSTADRGGDAQANPVSTGAPAQTRKKAAVPGTGG